MKNTKLTTLLLAAAVPSAMSFGNIALTDTLAVRGFIDSSYSYQDIDGVGDTESIGVDAFDIDFLVDGESVDAEVHLSSIADAGAFGVEQAFFTYDLGSGLNVTGGKYLSLHGYEGDEPYKLYQYSYAFNIGNSAKIPFAAYHSGVKASYGTDTFTGTVSVVDSVYTNDGDAEDLGVEAQIKYTGLEGFVIAIGTAQDDQNAVAGVDKYWNFWAEYSGIEKLVLAAEYNSYEFSEQDADSWMVLGNYTVSDKLAVTLRYSDIEEDFGNYEGDKFTVSPSYSISDDLLAVFEYSTGEDDGSDYDDFAVELIWTF